MNMVRAVHLTVVFLLTSLAGSGCGLANGLLGVGNPLQAALDCQRGGDAEGLGIDSDDEDAIICTCTRGGAEGRYASASGCDRLELGAHANQVGASSSDDIIKCCATPDYPTGKDSECSCIDYSCRRVDPDDGSFDCLCGVSTDGSGVANTPLLDEPASGSCEGEVCCRFGSSCGCFSGVDASQCTDTFQGEVVASCRVAALECPIPFDGDEDDRLVFFEACR